MALTSQDKSLVFDVIEKRGNFSDVTWMGHNTRQIPAARPRKRVAQTSSPYGADLGSVSTKLESICFVSHFIRIQEGKKIPTKLVYAKH